MMYNVTIYGDFAQLAESDSNTADLLLKELGLSSQDVGKRPWMSDELRVYPSIHNFCVYELTDGWRYNYQLSDGYNGAPNPVKYVDTVALGVDLINLDNSRTCCLLPGGKVVTTNYEW